MSAHLLVTIDPMTDQNTLLDAQTVRRKITDEIGEGARFKTLYQAAKHYGIHVSQLGAFINGHRLPEPKILAALGLERVVFYRKAA
jgi:hypothetical protein